LISFGIAQKSFVGKFIGNPFLMMAISVITLISGSSSNIPAIGNPSISFGDSGIKG